MSYLMLIVAFIAMSGIALFWCHLLKLNMGEGIFLAASTIIFVLYGMGRNSFDLAMRVLEILAVIGIVLLIVSCIKRKKIRLPYGGGVSYAVLWVFFLLAIALFHGDFIQHIDEFHQWAAAVKYMLENNRLAVYSDFIGGVGHPLGTSVFHLFFQRFTRYNEGFMYISSLLLYMVGFLLPWGNATKTQYKQAFLYSITIYISLFTLYVYGSKNLYVDLPTASWMTGITTWWIFRKNNSDVVHNHSKMDFRRIIGNLTILLSEMIAVYTFKSKFGLLLDAFLLFFILLNTLFVERKIQNNDKIKKIFIYFGIPIVIVCILGGISAVFIIYSKFIQREVPIAFSNHLDFVRFSNDKVIRTLGEYLTILAGGSLANKRSILRLPFLWILLLSLALLYIGGNIHNKKNRNHIYMIYVIVISCIYSGILVCSYLVFMSYEESIKISAGPRYLSLLAIYLFGFSLCLLFADEGGELSKHSRWSVYVGLAVLLFFALGINKHYIPYNTSYNSEKVKGYKEIKFAKSQTDKLLKVINADDKVYLLNQKGTRSNEYGTNTALYYLDNQVSNYLNFPWKFIKTGSVSRLAKFEWPSIEQFPQVLTFEPYTYVWVMSSDKYLKKNLPKAIKCTGGPVKDGNLYKIIYLTGWPVELKLVDNLVD